MTPVPALDVGGRATSLANDRSETAHTATQRVVGKRQFA